MAPMTNNIKVNIKDVSIGNPVYILFHVEMQ